MANVAAAEAEVKAARVEIDRLTVRAPVEGDILQVNIRPGEFAPSGATPEPLILLGNLDKLHVRVDIDENDAWRYQPDAPAVAYIRGNPQLKTDLTFEYVESLRCAEAFPDGGQHGKGRYPGHAGGLQLQAGQTARSIRDSSWMCTSMTAAPPVPACLRSGERKQEMKRSGIVLLHCSCAWSRAAPRWVRIINGKTLPCPPALALWRRGSPQ